MKARVKSGVIVPIVVAKFSLVYLSRAEFCFLFILCLLCMINIIAISCCKSHTSCPRFFFPPFPCKVGDLIDLSSPTVSVALNIAKRIFSMPKQSCRSRIVMTCALDHVRKTAGCFPVSHTEVSTGGFSN